MILSPPPLTGNGVLDRWLAVLFKYLTSAFQFSISQIDTTENVPVTVTASTHTATAANLIINYAGTCTLTLPSAATYPGRQIGVRTITANTVVSASSNVVPRDGSAASTAILPATDGAWAVLLSDGTNWLINQSS